MPLSVSSAVHRPGVPAVWTPPAALRRDCGLADYLEWLDVVEQRSFADYRSLWEWSISDLDAFWKSIDRFEGLGLGKDGGPALLDTDMPGTRWFPGAKINYAEHAFRRAPGLDVAALICVSEGSESTISWGELRRQVGALAAHLRDAGVGKGDRVVGYLPNTEVPVVGLLACASLGAVWSVCSPEFGHLAVLRRFAQLRPKVLIAAARAEDLAEIVAGLDTLEQVVYVDDDEPPRTPLRHMSWAEASAGHHPIRFVDVEFDHPLWVQFSSDTTEMPRGIVHGHGGIVLEHLKLLRLHSDLRAEDRLLFPCSTSQTVWNLQVGGLLIGATLVLVDGSLAGADLGRIWQIADRHRVAILGVGAAYIDNCRNDEQRPGQDADFGALRSIIVTGSSLGPDGFCWVRENVGPGVWLASISGGTDVCSAFVGGVPLLTVRSGRMQAPALGVAVAAWDEEGRPVVGQPGELVVSKPMPSMPLYFWGDAEGARYLDSYFRMFPGVWRHGDVIEFDADGTSVMHGRSDAATGELDALRPPSSSTARP
ncbi:AMP-binding protein [Mycolicibacterium septicum]|uniref:AMP-binding protein n=1 Tax=Mycolicibacterium septicum TaxID=98668 RepID=UPI002360DB8C|nr:AMP-binding protein [Mycolicibacterium septicum]